MRPALIRALADTAVILALVVICIIFMHALSGCSTVNQKLDPTLLYKRDMGLTVNGFEAEGMLVVPHSDSYTMNLEAQGNLDLFTLTTCHREEAQENAGPKGWFKDKRKVTLQYVPTPLEHSGLACPLELGGYERIKGRHSWGLVDFEDPGITLPAKISCNGSVSNAKGVSVCQSRKGLLQEIDFPEPVFASTTGSCPGLTAVDGQHFQFEVQRGECVYRFVTKGQAEKWHRLTTFGYESILIRED